ncbi:trigger factor [Pedobacter sp.]|nr:trigger factor [Candidatus Saccharibacteria bacterium]
MKHTLKNLSDTKVSIIITVSSEELLHAKGHALKTLGPRMSLAGFRPGKVPANVAEKHLDPSALASETAEEAINHAINEVIKLEDLRVLDQPSVELGEFKPYESLEFTAEIEILPAVTLGDYTKLKAKKEKVVVSEDEVDQVLQRMRQGFGEKKEVSRAAKTGDEVVIDFEGRDKAGELVAGAAGTDYPLTLGSNSFIPGFEDGLVGKKVGETFELPLTFPKDYHAEALKGAKVTFKTTIKKVTEVDLPVVDDAFAKKAGPFETATELLDDIKNEILVQKERVADDKLKDDLLGELADKSTVPYSEVLVNDQMNSVEQDTMQNLMYRGLSPEQYMESQGFKDRDEWREKEFKTVATNRVRSGLVLAELSKAEKIEVSKEELEARLVEMKQQYKDPKTQAQLDTPESRRNLANRVLTEKTIDRLIEINIKK